MTQLNPWEPHYLCCAKPSWQNLIPPPLLINKIGSGRSDQLTASLITPPHISSESSLILVIVTEWVECGGGGIAAEIFWPCGKLHHESVPLHCGRIAALSFLPYSQPGPDGPSLWRVSHLCCYYCRPGSLSAMPVILKAVSQLGDKKAPNVVVRISFSRLRGFFVLQVLSVCGGFGVLNLG